MVLSTRSGYVIVLSKNIVLAPVMVLLKKNPNLTRLVLRRFSPFKCFHLASRPLWKTGFAFTNRNEWTNGKNFYKTSLRRALLVLTRWLQKVGISYGCWIPTTTRKDGSVLNSSTCLIFFPNSYAAALPTFWMLPKENSFYFMQSFCSNLVTLTLDKTMILQLRRK